MSASGPSLPSSLEIAQRATLRPVVEIASSALGLLEDEVEPYGRHKAKVRMSAFERLSGAPDGKIVAITAITPTRAGEGKTTTAVSLTQGMGRLGKRVMLCLRQPSMGPVFGIKGGGTGGGYAQVLPMEDINLHLTGDFHAVTAAHNLLAAALDASIFHGNPLGIDARNVTWPRTLDVNDRSLRQLVVGLGGRAHGVPRESGFVITAASEVMALLALASDLADLRARLGQVVVAETGKGEAVTAEALGAAGAMAVLLKEAIMPNLVQTLEGQPVFLHTGPFGNIASGNSSIIATRLGRRLADYVITEGGFGSDLGFEKFCHLVCRYGNLRPSAAVLVVTGRALKAHGGVPDGPALAHEDLPALERGAANLAAHLDVTRAFGVATVVAVNRFPTDTDAEIDLLRDLALRLGASRVVLNEGFEKGGAGAVELAEAVVETCEGPEEFAPINPPGMPIADQVHNLATRLYGAEGVAFSYDAQRQLDRLNDAGLGQLPVCMAKTHLSLSHDPTKKGRPRGFELPVRSLVPSVGAGFVVAICGDIMLMPGLGRSPSLRNVDIDAEGRTVGLF